MERHNLADMSFSKGDPIRFTQHGPLPPGTTGKVFRAEDREGCQVVAGRVDGDAREKERPIIHDLQCFSDGPNAGNHPIEHAQETE